MHVQKGKDDLMKLFTPKKKTDEPKVEEKISPVVLTAESSKASTSNEQNLLNVENQKNESGTSTSIEKEVKIMEQSQENNSTFQVESTSDADKIKKLVEIVSGSNEKSIIPSIDFETNRISYPILKNIGEDEHNVSFLEKLASESSGILEKSIYERWMVCPQHPNELSVTIRRYCPECSSIDIERLQLIEHKVCGYIAEMEKYGVRSASDLQKCPNCKRPIKNLQKEIRMPGRWNICNSCNKKFDSVIIKMRCRKFNHDFDINEVDTITIPYYKIKGQEIESFTTVPLLSSIKKKLESLGFIVNEAAVIKGKSGVEHRIDIHAQNNENKTVAVFIKSAKDAIGDAVVNSVLVDVLDISPTRTIFIGIPAMSQVARTMAASHGINIVTGDNLNQIIAEVNEILSKDAS